VLISPVLAEPLMLSREKIYLIGRDDNADIRIKADKVSRAHAEIEWNDKCFVIRDLGSTNGSTLNGKPLGKTRIPLFDNDRLTFGGFEILLNVLAPGEFPDMELGGQTRRMKLPLRKPKP
jgi:pSer/pThr/pTyr-binding forkhead associated (FHA) protein